MKEAFRLLDELEDATRIMYHIRIFSDYSGRVFEDDLETKSLFSFKSKSQLKKKLRIAIMKATS